MVFVAASILFACVLPSVMGLTLDTPTNAAADSVLAVTWTTVKTDPKFSLLLVGKTESFDVATGIDPTTLKSSVGLGNIPPGSYKLQAVVADDIDTVVDTTGSFNLAAAGAVAAAPPPAAGGGNNAAAGGGAAAGTGAAAVKSLTLNTPTNAAADSVLAVTWATAPTDPKFSLLLVGATESFDVATGIDPTTLKTSVGLGNIPPGTYKLQAVVADDIDTVLSTTGSFPLAAAAAAGGNNAAAGAGNNAGGGAAAVTTTSAAAAAAKTTAAAAAGNGGKGGAAAAAAAKAAAAKAAAAKAAAAKATAAKAAAAKAAAAKAAAAKAAAAKKPAAPAKPALPAKAPAKAPAPPAKPAAKAPAPPAKPAPKPAPKAPAPPAKPAPKAPAAPAKKGPRSVVSAKFGRGVFVREE